jgi:hypothetical protein
MRNTLEDYEFNKAVKEVERLLTGIYCTCTGDAKGELVDIPSSKEIVFAVLEAIEISY